MTDNRAMDEDHRAGAAAVEATRQACIAAALAAYEDAGVLGLCAEGRWEAAISAMQSLDLRRVAAPGDGSSGPAV